MVACSAVSTSGGIVVLGKVRGKVVGDRVDICGEGSLQF